MESDGRCAWRSEMLAVRTVDVSDMKLVACLGHKYVLVVDSDGDVGSYSDTAF